MKIWLILHMFTSTALENLTMHCEYNCVRCWQPLEFCTWRKNVPKWYEIASQNLKASVCCMTISVCYQPAADWSHPYLGALLTLADSTLNVLLALSLTSSQKIICSWHPQREWKVVPWAVLLGPLEIRHLDKFILFLNRGSVTWGLFSNGGHSRVLFFSLDVLCWYTCTTKLLGNFNWKTLGGGRKNTDYENIHWELGIWLYLFKNSLSST